MKNKQTLSVVLAARNEEENIGRCLEAVKDIADEIVVFDEESEDKTRKIARRFGARVFKVKHESVFHITKQKAIDKATGDWILQLDADEVVSSELAKEIVNVINLADDKIRARRPGDGKKWKLFQRHQRVVEERDGKLGKDTGEIVAYWVPRRTIFIDKPIMHAGIYPDAVIRLIKKGKARLPGKSVHEQMEIDGEAVWLFNDLEHHTAPTLKLYVARMNLYTDQYARDFKKQKVPKNVLYFIHYSTLKPFIYFLKLFIRHKGFMDGMHGYMWCLLSAMHFPIGYYKYWISY